MGWPSQQKELTCGLSKAGSEPCQFTFTYQLNLKLSNIIIILLPKSFLQLVNSIKIEWHSLEFSQQAFTS